MLLPMVEARLKHLEEEVKKMEDSKRNKANKIRNIKELD